jgi:hypothetical protein
MSRWCHVCNIVADELFEDIEAIFNGDERITAACLACERRHACYADVDNLGDRRLYCSTLVRAIILSAVSRVPPTSDFIGFDHVGYAIARIAAGTDVRVPPERLNNKET